MICPLENSDSLPYVTAFTLSKPASSRILVRVMNSSESPIQLHAGQKIAQFIPVIESTTVSRSLDVLGPRTSAGNICASISCQSVMNDCTLKELETAINPSLSVTDKHVLLEHFMNFLMFLTMALATQRLLRIRLTQGNLPPYVSTLGVSLIIFVRKLKISVMTCYRKALFNPARVHGHHLLFLSKRRMAPTVFVLIAANLT